MLKLGKDGIEFSPDKHDSYVKWAMNKIFWAFIIALGYSFLRPEQSMEQLGIVLDAIQRARATWGERITRWFGVTMEMVTTWSEWLLDGGIRIIRWSAAIAASIVVLYSVGLVYLPNLVPALTLLVGLAVLAIIGVAQLVPAKLYGGPAKKQRAKDTVGVLGMWPIALAFAFVCFPFTWTGKFVAMVAALGMFYLIKGGHVRWARIVAHLVMWSAITFQAISSGLPALRTGVAGGLAKQVAGRVMFWDTERSRAADMQSALEDVIGQTSSRRAYGLAADTIASALLPRMQGQQVVLDELATAIEPGERLELLSDQAAEAWGAQMADALLSAIGDTSRHVRAAAMKKLGFTDVVLAAYADPAKRKAFADQNGTPVFYVAWASVRTDGSVAANGSPGTGSGEAPPELALAGTVDGQPVTGSIPITESFGSRVDGWVEVTVDARNPVASIPFRTARGDVIEVEYRGGNVAHGRLPDGSLDPKYMDGRGAYHYTDYVGPQGYAPDPDMAKPWQRRQTQLLKQGAAYMALLYSTAPTNETMHVVFEPGETDAELQVVQPGTRLYLALNDAWMDSKWSGNAASYLRSQCSRRVGEIKVRLRVLKPDATGGATSYASR